MNEGSNGDISISDGIKAALDHGQAVFAMPHVDPPLPAQVPVNPVKAKVYVLTDYGCASACIAFVDEMKRFPGVVQVGVETWVDNRTGTPLTRPLPSGNGIINVAVMVRDGRVRDDAVPQRPTHEFAGDIENTDAVKAWLAKTVLPQDGLVHFQLEPSR